MTEKVMIKKLRDSARLPSYTTEGAAGFDLYADLEGEMTILPMERVMVPTGIAMQIASPNLCGMCYARSGLATKYGITLSNGVGVIDNDYTGEIKVGLINLSREVYTIRPHDRIAQIVITPVVRAILEEAEQIEQTRRGDGGFGSTGR